MPSLFNRRSRSVSTSRPIAPASSSAHLAASQAFLASQSSHSNLSASAAAAALRTMSPTPTPVNQVQTKRMLNRQPSNSSVASASRGRSRGTVQRRTSSGSMTERTFRSPSPGQSTSQPEHVAGVGRGAPPVPPLPRNYVTGDTPSISNKSHRRSASMETPPTRVSSPPLSRPTGRGQNVNQTPAVSAAATTAARRSAKPVQSYEMKRSDSSDSRNSVNFSYPRGSRPISPPPRSPLASTGDGFPAPAPASSGVSAAEAARIQSDLAQTAANPVKKKKKRVNQSAVEGSHLQTGTMGAKPTVTPLGPLPADYEPATAVQAVKKTKKKAALTGESTHFPDSPEAATTEVISDSDEVLDSPKDRRALRSAGVLMKQPSVVREDWEGEQEEQESSPIEAAATGPVRILPGPAISSRQPKKTTTAANMSRKIEDPAVNSKPASSMHDTVTMSSSQMASANKTLQPAAVEAQAGRGASISPSRSFRFSDRLASDLAAGRKHEPLGRSVSPAKSALKHSYAASDASPTDPKFPHRRASSVTPSEVSDVSTDDLTGRKKPARVSFEGFSDVKDSLAEIRATKEAHKTGYGGKGKSSNLGTISSDNEVEEGMKPRPALPSFGSVRRSERSMSPNPTAEAPSKGIHTNIKTASSSETSSIADPPTMDTSISSDFTLGAMLYKESQKSAVSSSNWGSNAPSPPQVTSVEGTGYASDSDSVYSEDGKSFQAARTASRSLGKTFGDSENTSLHNDGIPVIAVQPATPGLDESRSREEWVVDVPGGFPASGASSNVSLQDNSDKQIDPTTPSRNHTGLGLTATSQNYSPSMTREDSPGSSAQQLMTITEEDSDDNNSVYSDAAEDLSDLEGDGFGSINAIVESPMISAPQPRTQSPPESPSVGVAERRPGEVERTASWDDTQAHWSGLAQRFRSGNQQVSDTAAAPETTSKVAAIAPAKIRKTKPQTTHSAVTSAAKPATKPSSKPQPHSQVVNQVRNQSSTSSAALAKRAPISQPQGQLRSSMRDRSEPVIPAQRASNDRTQGHMRSSMRDEVEPPVAAKRQRPISSPEPISAPRAALQKKNIPPTAVPKAPVRRFSNDSDSDSSFKKARRNKKSADGTYSMRRSMRASPAETERPSAPAGRGGVRSMSPPVDRRPTSPLGAKSMRTTMRSSMDMGTPTLRGQPEQKRSSSLFSRNRTAKSPTRPASAIVTLPTKLKSRIADSDDEDEPRPAHYKSRFADSSDEDEPKTFRPVRGIPRKKDEDESTDLSDSSEDQARKSKPAAPKQLTIVPPPPSQEVTSPPASPTTAKKRGLWSRFRGRKKEEEAELNTPQTITQQDSIKEDIDTGKKEPNNAKQLGFNSAAERDAMIEQTRLKLEAAKDRPQSPTGRPGSPLGKLQRRMTPQRILSDSWAPPRMPAAVADRPQTSDGFEEASRPGIGSRQPTLEVVNGNGTAYGRNGKKKKFGFLRKAFGLND